MYQEERFSPLSKLALLLGLCGAGFIIAGIVSVAIAQWGMHAPAAKISDALKDPKNIDYIRWLQAISTFLLMALPAYIFWLITSPGNVLQKIGFSKCVSLSQIIFLGIMVIAGFVISGALSTVTELIPLHKPTESFFRKLETEYNDQVMLLASMKTAADFFISLILLALLPAVFEEMMFRGTLQPVVIGVTKNAAVGIIITSAFFSAIHLSYYGFLPRLFLGVMLGYIFYYSKNIWLSIAAHFLNNAWALFSIYIFAKRGGKPTEMRDENLPLYIGIIGGIIIVFIFIAYRKESRKVYEGCIQKISND